MCIAKSLVKVNEVKMNEDLSVMYRYPLLGEKYIYTTNTDFSKRYRQTDANMV